MIVAVVIIVIINIFDDRIIVAKGEDTRVDFHTEITCSIKNWNR